MTQFGISAEIEVNDGGTLWVGEGKTNQLKLTLTNEGGALDERAARSVILSLRVELGAGESALFLNESDAHQCKVAEARGWKHGRANRHADFTFSPQMALSQGSQHVFVLSSVVSRTSAGQAKLTFKAAAKQGSSASSQELWVSKQAQSAQVLGFTAKLSFTRPEQPTKLVWSTHQMKDCQISIESTNVLLHTCERAEGEFTVEPSVTTTYRLSGKSTLPGAGPPEPKLTTITVREPGWYAKSMVLGEEDVQRTKFRPLGEESVQVQLFPSLLFQEEALYGVFRTFIGERMRAFLLQSLYPLDGWQLLETSVDQRSGEQVPAASTTSPGVFFDNELWLVGGSQVDDATVSNDVWSVAHRAEKPHWVKRDEPPWQPRMGHAVLEYQGKLWVMGGCDVERNPLNDVWAWDPISGKWTRLFERAPWSPRCMFASVVFGDAVYVLGGREEPAVDEAFSRHDAHVYKDGKWSSCEALFEPLLVRPEGKAQSLSLFAFQGKLHCFGKYRRAATQGGSVSTCVIDRLNSEHDRNWEGIDNKGLKILSEENEFVAHFVGLRDELLVSAALTWGNSQAEIRVFLPPRSTP
jgi:hypothetical protein